MLATLPVVHRIGVFTRGERVFNLVRTPIFIGGFSDGGQGPEKPIIEEKEIEEEVFSFPYPEEKGEISDIVNPPIEGIAGEVLNSKSELRGNFIIRTPLDVLSYVFINPDSRRAIKNSELKFISLTKQSEIAGSYAGLLVYSGYAASNADFNYTSDGVYESSTFTEKRIPYFSDKHLYESKVPLPMISEIVYYNAKENHRVYVKPLTQPKLQIYQKAIDKASKFPAVDSWYEYNSVDSDIKPELKLDYKSPKLELPLLKNEPPVLDLNIENNENNVAVPKYDASIKYQTMKDVVDLPINLGFDDTLMRDRFIEKLNTLLIESEQHNTDLMEEPTRYNVRSFNLSLDNQPLIYDKARVDLDPYALFNLQGSEQRNYQGNLEVRNILLPNTEYKAGSNLDNLVKVNYDNGRVLSSPNTAANSYNLDLVDVKLHLDANSAPVDTSNYDGVFPEQNLEEVIEQERELAEERIEEKPDENIGAEVYDGNIAEKAIYEKSEIQEEQETETNESEDSSVGYLAAAAGAVGLGVLGGVAGAVGALFKKEDYETENEKGIFWEDKKKKIDDPKEDTDSTRCFKCITAELEDGTDEYKRLLEDQIHKGKKWCYTRPEIEAIEDGSVHKVFPRGLGFTVKNDDSNEFGEIRVRGNNRIKYGGTLKISKDTLGYQFWNLLEEKGIIPYARLDRGVKEFEKINGDEKLFFDYLIGPHINLGETNLNFFVKDENSKLIDIDDTNLNTQLPSGEYTVELFLEQKNPNYKAEYGKTLEEINKTRILSNGKVAPNLYSLKNSKGEIVEGVVALLDCAFVTNSSFLGHDLVGTDIKEGTLAAQIYKATIDVGINPIIRRMDTIEKGTQKGNNTIIFDFEDAYEQYKKRYTNAKDELLGTGILKIDLDTGKVEREPGYGIGGIETKVQDGVYLPVVAEQGVDYRDLRVDVKKLCEILAAKGMKLPEGKMSLSYVTPTKHI